MEVYNEVIVLFNGGIRTRDNLYFTKIMNIEVCEVLTKPILH
jgi:hypothetical protein